MAKILIADDQLVMRNMFKVILQDQDHEVTFACDGAEAYTKATGTQFDLVLSDLYMPEVNGIELVRKLRGLSNYNGVPILIISTEKSVGKKSEGREAGANGWIVKPITRDRLLPAIHKLLG